MAADEPVSPWLLIVGEDNIAITDGRSTQPIEELDGQVGNVARGEFDAAILPDDPRTAVVLATDHLALVTSDGNAELFDCVGCSSVAASDEYVITVRANAQPDFGFDILLYDHQLNLDRTIAVHRLTERQTIGYPSENAATPQVVAASANAIWVTYLSENGGVRGGPDIVAQYSYDGELTDSTYVEGITWRSAVSPDGEFLALAVAGFGGWCISAADLVVLRLDGMEQLDVGPQEPVEVTAAAAGAGESSPWSWITDLTWNDTEVTAMTDVYRPGVESCDETPDAWAHHFDVESGQYRHVLTGDVVARRWVGPDCDDVVEAIEETNVIDGSEYSPDSSVVARVNGAETSFDEYSHLFLGQPLPSRCSTP